MVLVGQHTDAGELTITRIYGLGEANQALADVAQLKVVKALIRP